MELRRALLLSTLRKAGAGEYEEVGLFSPRRMMKYFYLVSLNEDKSLVFEIYHVTYPKRQDGGLDKVVAKEPHARETFKDLGELVTFLHRYQIDRQSFSPHGVMPPSPDDESSGEGGMKPVTFGPGTR